jgi:hypothetical protein
MKTKINKFETQRDWDTYIGKQIIKHSGKPFKSGKKIGIPLEITVNPNSNKKAFLMDDGSVVDCSQTKLYETTLC